jgi:hypothetical protein
MPIAQNFGVLPKLIPPPRFTSSYIALQFLEINLLKQVFGKDVDVTSVRHIISRF